jgi:hypothetical protein
MGGALLVATPLFGWMSKGTDTPISPPYFASKYEIPPRKKPVDIQVLCTCNEKLLNKLKKKLKKKLKVKQKTVKLINEIYNCQS